MTICVWPATVSMTAGVPPLYGTCVMAMPAVLLKYSVVRWLKDACPLDAYRNRFCFPRARFTSSLTERAGTAGCTVIINGASATIVIGVKSRSGS